MFYIGPHSDQFPAVSMNIFYSVEWYL